MSEIDLAAAKVLLAAGKEHEQLLIRLYHAKVEERKLREEIRRLTQANGDLRKERDRAAKEVPVKQWRCYHCDQVFTDPILAAAHFGDDRKNPRPAACEGLLNAYAEAFERYGIHRNHHNVASVKQLANRFQGEVDKLRAQNTALAAHVVRLKKALKGVCKLRKKTEATHQAAYEAMFKLPGRKAFEDAAEALAATPAQSLAAHDAAVKVAVLREVAGEIKQLIQAGAGAISVGRNGWIADVFQLISAKADRIAKEAAPEVYDVWKEASNG